MSTTAAATNTAVSFSPRLRHCPSPPGNTYQGGSTTVTLTFHAVQSANNPLPATCTTAGAQCLPGSGFVWS